VFHVCAQQQATVRFVRFMTEDLGLLAEGFPRLLPVFSSEKTNPSSKIVFP
jgi:hypothetical protein